MKKIPLELKTGIHDFEISQDCEIDSIYIGKGFSKIKNSTKFIFTNTSVKANITIKCAVYDSASIDLDLKLIVPKGMKMCEGFLTIKVLNMSESGKINIIPGLEIMENDTKCGHALTIGKPDKNEVQYLMSRGLTKHSAEKIILEGFLQN